MPILDPDLLEGDPSKDPIQSNDRLVDVMYQKGYDNAFGAEELALLKTIKRASRIHKRFNLLEPEQGYEKYSKLTSDEQNVLKYFYGDGNGYMQTPENLLGKFRLGVGAVISSPFKGLFGVAEKYGAVLNAVTLAQENQMVNGENLMNLPGLFRLFTDSESFYDNGVVDRLTKKWGPVKSYIAKETLNGSNIEEIIGHYGKLTPEFVEELSSFVNEESVWQEGILEDFRQAKLGGGRFVARALFGNRGLKSKSLLGDSTKVNKGQDDTAFTWASGTAGLAQMVLTDPLSYFTGGGSAGVRFLGKSSFKLPVLGEVRVSTRAFINDLAKKNDVRGLFAEKDVRRFWDAYGHEVHLLTIARENGENKKAAEILTRIKENFTRHNTDEEIEWAISNKFYSAQRVEDYALAANNFAKAISGRVAQIDYHKFGVATAADIRKEGIGVRHFWNKIAASESSYKNVDVAAKEFVDEIKMYGAEQGFKSASPVIDQSIEDVKKFNAAFRKLTSLHPSDEYLEMGEKAGDTISTVRNMFRLIAPRDIADTGAEIWLSASVGERYQMYAGYYRALAIKMGIDKLPGGMEKVEELINTKFGEIGMRVSGRDAAKDAAGWVVTGDKAIDLPKFVDDIEGPLYDMSTVNKIGNLDWMRLYELQAAAARAGEGQLAKTRIGLYVGGVVNSTAVSIVNDVWTLAALFLKMGVRGSIDEQTNFALNAPRQVQQYYWLGKAKSGAKVMTRFTADKASTGAIGQLARKLFIKPFGIKGGDPLNEIGNARRQDILANVIMQVADEELPEEAIMPMFNKLLAHEAAEYAHLLSPQEAKWMAEGLIANPNFLKSAEATTARSIGLGAVSPDVKVHFIEDTMLTQTLDAEKVSRLPNYRLVQPKELSEEKFKIVMYDKMFRTFYHNIIHTGKSRGLNLGELFIYHNGLRETKDAKAFIDTIVNSLTYKGKLTEAGKTFIMNRKGAEAKLLKGQYNVQIIEDFARVIAQDMYAIFHGNMDSFNDELLDYFRNNPDPKLAAGTLKDFLNNLDFEIYSGVVKGKNVRREAIASNLNFGGIQKDWNFFKTKVYEFYDRTITSMHRAPATVSYYLYYRKFNEAAEKGAYQAEFKAQMATDLPDMLSKKYGPVLGKQKFAEMIERKISTQFAELALNNAIHSVLATADNPHVRTNFVVAARNMSRFARATEDMWRRIYRLKNVTPQAIYRLRLIHNGLNNAGSSYEDQNGDMYFAFPSDNIIFAALNPVFEKITGQGFLSPGPGSEYTTKFSALNPSFQDQAGIPYQVGPLAVLQVLGLQAMANTFGGDNGPLIADKLDNLILGEMSDNVELQSLLPGILNRTASILNREEMSEVNHSAILSAISVAQAYGNALPADANPRQVEKWLDDRRTEAHNFIVMRAIMGTIMPFGVSSQEIGDMPNYIRDMGYTNIRSEYYAILLGILDNYGDDISEPFELASAIFNGKNPGKSVYTISRNDKKIKPIIAQTEETREWILTHKKFIRTYAPDGNAAYFFAPQTGTLDKGGYKWLRNVGLIEDIPIEDFLSDAQVVIDKQKYFDISDWEEEQLANVTDMEKRRNIIAKASAMRNAMKAANPRLEKALRPEGGFDDVDEMQMYRGIRAIVNDETSPISDDQRMRTKNALGIFKDTLDYFDAIKWSSSSSLPQLKAGTRDRVIDELKKMAQGDPMLQQMNRLVFIPVLKYRARDQFSANPVG